MENYYELINVNPESSIKEIKKRFQELLLKYHPDKQLTDSPTTSNNFLKIQEARKILLDPEERRAYDRKLKEKQLEQFDRPIYSSTSIDELEFDEDLKTYYSSCRCGGLYNLSKEEIAAKTVVYVPCDDCTFYLEVYIPA